MKAILRQVRISSRKAALVADLVRGKKAEDAIAILRFTPKKASQMIKKVIESAVANAESNFKQNKETLYVKEVIVTEGTTYKRGIHISRGRTHPLLKRTAHIFVKLESRKNEGHATKSHSEPKGEPVKSEQGETLSPSKPKKSKAKSK